MKPTAIVALPSSASENTINHVCIALDAAFHNVQISYEMKDDIMHPIARTFADNGADLGNVDGSRDATLFANITGIQRTADKLFRSAILIQGTTVG